MNLKEDYTLANCCKPQKGDEITGYFSHNGIIKVHKSDCTNLNKSDTARLVSLEWTNIIGEEDYKPESDYDELNGIDFQILNHHKVFGVDYSLKMARMLNLDKQDVFDSHNKLRSMKLLERVKELMMQYRKGIVDNKWIKHRNHTYYKLTDKGAKYLEYYERSNK